MYHHFLTLKVERTEGEKSEGVREGRERECETTMHEPINIPLPSAVFRRFNGNIGTRSFNRVINNEDIISEVNNYIFVIC